MVDFNNTLYKTYLLDTCVASEYIKDKEFFAAKINQRVLLDGIFCLSPYTFWEIKASPIVYKEFKEIFTILPTCIVKTDIGLLDEEVQNYHHPNVVISPIIAPIMESMYAKEGIDIHEIIDKVITNAKVAKYKDDESELHEDFKKSSTGFLDEKKLNNIKEIESSVEWGAFISLAHGANEFAKNELTPTNPINIRHFNSLMALNYIYHYKYGDITRNPIKSDITDILLCAVLPFIDVFITEGNLKAHIIQIQNRHGFFKNLEVVSIKDVREKW